MTVFDQSGFFRSPGKLPKLIGPGKKLESISRTPMPDSTTLDEEDAYSHHIDIDAEDDVMITEVEKGANEKVEDAKRKTKREDSGKETTDEEFATDELLEEERTNNDKMDGAKGNFSK